MCECGHQCEFFKPFMKDIWVSHWIQREGYICPTIKYTY
jgi:hypothetical protein